MIPSKSTLLWLPNQVLDFVLMLFGIPYINPEIHAFAVGVVALWFYIHVARAIIALFKKAFGFQSNERR
tara:strand:- start:245 stop:451 length:207 start_codon:yes stop_codon:yes gene_type:complete